MNIKKLKIILFILIIIFTTTCLIAYKYNSDNNAKRLYKQGMEFYNKKNYSDAYYNFKQIKQVSSLYSLALLKQYQCAIGLGDKKTAHSKIKELLNYTNDENIKPYAIYYEAILAEELQINNKNQIIKKLKYVYKTYPQNDFAIASAYKIATLENNKDKNDAKEKYIQYLKYAPQGKYALNSLDNLKSYNTLLTTDDLNIIGDSYLTNLKYKEALDIYLKTDFDVNWFKISKCYKGLKRNEEEKETILKGLYLNYSPISEKEIDTALDRLIALTNSNKIQILQDFYTKLTNTSYIYPTVTYKLAESGTSIRSIKLYEYIVNNYPKSIWTSNSMWELFWHNYKLKRYKICKQLAYEHMNKYPNAQDAPRIAYWWGKTLLIEKKNQQARDVFYKVIKNYPLSYYSFLSARQLKISKAKRIIVKKPISKYDINHLNNFIFKDSILYYLAQNEDYQTIEELKINDDFISSWVMYKKNNYPKSIILAKDKYISNKNNDTEEIEENNKISFNDKELKLIYPILYEDIINKYAIEFKQSPYLFLSLVREESHFDKNAKSSANAIGLTQLLPSTASFIEKTNISKITLLNEDENIRIGLKYFTYLTEFFKGNEYLAILAYNAGPGNINKWLNNPFIIRNDIDEFVENIPYIETKNYIKKIISSYWCYINIYSPKNKL